MSRRQFSSKDFNLERYWDTFDIESGTAVASVTATLAVPRNCLVNHVLAYVLKEAEGGVTSTCTLVVGDSTDDDAFLLSSNLKLDKGELYGNDADDLGVYLKTIRPYQAEYTELTPETPHEQLLGKYFKDESTIQAKTTVGTAVLTAQGKARIWVSITRLHIGED